MKKLLLVLAAALVLAAPLAAVTPELDSEYRQAHLAYREGRYQEAYDGYARLLGAAGADGQLLYNLGNAAFRLNQIGRAILYYEKAQVLLPRDADLKFNLGHAREQTRDVIPEPESFVGTAFFWLGSLTLAEFFWCFVVANVLFWGILAVRIYSRAEWTYSLLFLLLGVWLLAGISFGVKWQQTRSDDRAVILQTEVNVLAGPDSRDTLLFKLHEGTVVHLERSEEGWSLIRLSDGRRGWLRGEGLERIRGPRVPA
jgi:tetratricopeptide (TPR) repeat protein